MDKWHDDRDKWQRSSFHCKLRLQNHFRRNFSNLKYKVAFLWRPKSAVWRFLSLWMHKGPPCVDEHAHPDTQRYFKAGKTDYNFFWASELVWLHLQSKTYLFMLLLLLWQRQLQPPLPLSLLFPPGLGRALCQVFYTYNIKSSKRSIRKERCPFYRRES